MSDPAGCQWEKSHGGRTQKRMARLATPGAMPRAGGAVCSSLSAPCTRAGGARWRTLGTEAGEGSPAFHPSAPFPPRCDSHHVPSHVIGKVTKSRSRAMTHPKADKKGCPAIWPEGPQVTPDSHSPLLLVGFITLRRRLRKHGYTKIEY